MTLEKPVNGDIIDADENQATAVESLQQNGLNTYGLLIIEEGVGLLVKWMDGGIVKKN